MSGEGGFALQYVNEVLECCMGASAFRLQYEAHMLL
jgi:hypothetical protein